MALPFNPWPSLRYAVAGYGASAQVVDYYVRTPAAGGSDILGTGTPGRPWATPARALAEAQRSQAIAVVHVGSGTYQRPIFRNVLGPVAFAGDGGGDPSDDGLAELLGPTAAGAGTSASQISGAFIADQYNKAAIEMLTGDAAGQRRSIFDTTATELVPARNFNPAPIAGDSYRIVVPAVIWDGFQTQEIWIQHCGNPSSSQFLAASTETLSPTDVQEGVHLVNIALSAVGTPRLRILASTFGAYGVDVQNDVRIDMRRSTLISGCDAGAGSAGAIRALLGLPSNFTYAGYCLVRRTISTIALVMSGGWALGMLEGPTVIIRESGHADFIGLALDPGNLQVDTGATVSLAPSNVPLIRVSVIGALDAVSLQNDGAIQWSQSAVTLRTVNGACVRAQAGGVARVAGGSSSVSTAGRAGNASQAGRIFIQGSPVGNWLGPAGNDWEIQGVVVPSGNFGSVNDTLSTSNGSVITRIS